MSDTGKIVALVKALAPVADQETVDSAVETYLDNHPEATTTVQDGSITEAKLASALAQKVNQVSSLSDEIVDINDRTKTDYFSSFNVLDESKLIDGYYNANTGNYASTASFKTLNDMIPIPDGASVVSSYTCKTTDDPFSTFYTLVFYDADKTFLSGTVSGGQSILTNATFAIPENARFVRPSFVVSSNIAHYVLTFEDILYGYAPYNKVTIPYNANLIPLKAEKFKGKRVLVIGDSISTPNYRGVTATGVNLPLWPKWPQILQKNLEFDLVSDAVSSSGFLVQPTTTTPGAKSICYRVDTYGDTDNYDFIIIFAGINDWIHNVTIGTVTDDRTANFASAVDYSVKTLATKYPKARIIGITPLPVRFYANPAQNDTSAIVNALKTIYSEYHVPVLDMNYSGFRPEIESFRNMFTLYGGSAGSYSHDGLHPNQEWDNNYLAPMISEFMSRYI